MDGGPIVLQSECEVEKGEQLKWKILISIDRMRPLFRLIHYIVSLYGLIQSQESSSHLYSWRHSVSIGLMDSASVWLDLYNMIWCEMVWWMLFYRCHVIAASKSINWINLVPLLTHIFPPFEGSETAESLKSKVQALEGSTFVRAVELFRTGLVGPYSPVCSAPADRSAEVSEFFPLTSWQYALYLMIWVCGRSNGNCLLR